ncbi:hypothetical protein [Phenylobacterium sp.]|uniref:hypothetical protein n=1 Tax=Phenylobacterium sp. TaxID=1871053 RepID=UPI0027314E40|nr:hypothetical protein [Phenylobacterium sp.]MDP1617398.1 hypothetical protein [Phenylobacterium sp.]MDP1988744.1 hypothetical protein [Phenylobacterium sp.]
MTALPLPRHGRALAVAAILSAALAGCATAPTEPVTTPTPSDGRSWGEMKPIPNPTDAQPASSAGAAAPAQTPRRATPTPAAPAAAPAPAKPSVDKARAGQLRAQGLVELNRGEVQKAVSLLRQAQQLDPDNTLIARDLQRAVRIQSAVTNRK